MEIDAIALVVIVISVSLTTFVCSILGKYCSEKFIIDDYEYRRRQRSSRARRRVCHQHLAGQLPVVHCHCCKNQRSPTNNNEIKTVRTSVEHRNNAQARCRSQSHGTDVKIQNFSQLAPSDPLSSKNPSHTFGRLGIATSKENGNFEFEGQLQTNDSSDLQFRVPQLMAQQQQMRLFNFGQMAGSFVEYDEIGTGVRNPGDGQHKEDQHEVKNIKPGCTGPVQCRGLSVINTNTRNLSTDHRADLDDNRTYNDLGIGKEENGDRLSPMSGLLEQTANSSSSGALTAICNTVISANATSQSGYEKPIRVYDIVASIKEKESFVGTSDEEGSGSDEVFTFSRRERKRLSCPLPRQTRHCSTCVCHAQAWAEDELKRKKTSEAEEMFERESAEKQLATLSDTMFKIPESAVKKLQGLHERKLWQLDFKPKEDTLCFRDGS